MKLKVYRKSEEWGGGKAREPGFQFSMTQNDLRNGRLVRLIGVAPDCPAEFVTFRRGRIETCKASVIKIELSAH